MIEDDTRMFDAVLQLEDAGYVITDVLPILRIIIISLTPEQLRLAEHKRDQRWNKESHISNRHPKK